MAKSVVARGDPGLNPVGVLGRNACMDSNLSSADWSTNGSVGNAKRHLALVAPCNDSAPSLQDQLNEWTLAVAIDHDRQAFASLFSHYGPRLRGWLWKTGSSGDEAQELVQDAFVILWRKAAQFDPARADVGAWLFTIARNLRVDRRRAIHDTWTTLTDANCDAVADPTEGQDIAVDRRQHGRLVRAAILKLAPDQRILVQLSFYEDMSHSMIAEQLKMPLGTVKTRLRRAASRLRTLLEECQP